MKASSLIITGASSGVGAAMAKRFGQQGSQVYAWARSEAALQEVADSAPDFIHPMRVDVCDREAVKAAVAEVEARGGAEMLINNAAAYKRSPFAEIDLEDADRMLDTNIKGTLYPTHAVLPGMIARKQGRILMINSVAGTRGIPDESVYCASKHAIVGFAESLMQELVPHNIQVSVINPGGINTPLWTKDGNFYPGDRSTLIEPEEVAEMADYVLSAPSRTLFKKMVFFPTGEWH